MRMILKLEHIMNADIKGKSYSTDNKRTVVSFFKENKDKHFTIDGALLELFSAGISIPKSSLYRIVGNLCREGVLRRFEAQGVDSFVYQYFDLGDECDNHFHLKCSECGKLVHLECEMLSDIKDHIFTEHGFIIGGENIITGVCKQCIKEKK